MTAYLTISYPSIREGCEMILDRAPMDYSACETIKEKEDLNAKWTDWLYNMHYAKIIAIGKEPDIYLVFKSSFEWDDTEHDDADFSEWYAAEYEGLLYRERLKSSI